MNHKTLSAALLAALALGNASAFAQDKMMGDKMMPDKMMMDKMMSGMSKSEKMMMQGMMMMRAGEVRVPLMTSPPAANAGLQDATGFADVNVAGGSVMEGWLSSAGRKGGPGPSTASDADQKFGPAFGMAELSNEARDVPYALSTGVLRRIGNTQTYFGRFQIDNALTPYAAVAVTVESDGNVGAYDPRPGSPLMAGMIAKGMMMGADGKMMDNGKMMMMGADKMMAPRLMMQMADGRLRAMQMLKGKMMMSMPNLTMAEIKMRDGKMMAMGQRVEGQLVMVMPDGTRVPVMMQNGKMMMAGPNGAMIEVKMMPEK